MELLTQAAVAAQIIMTLALQPAQMADLALFFSNTQYLYLP
jgi:hypothetical protein